MIRNIALALWETHELIERGQAASRMLACDLSCLDLVCHKACQVTNWVVKTASLGQLLRERSWRIRMQAVEMSS